MNILIVKHKHAFFTENLVNATFKDTYYMHVEGTVQYNIKIYLTL